MSRIWPIILADSSLGTAQPDLELSSLRSAKLRLTPHLPHLIDHDSSSSTTGAATPTTGVGLVGDAGTRLNGQGQGPSDGVRQWISVEATRSLLDVI
ncbi:hypothetical protein VV02_01970 [Luteipulveratus mongoliensis]|uniref:Uncharacterized protein n=1 Tax=Luteipulveratus mongoliensis TaxID=571913 RepID=A0A0K1JDY6_9MICO|nr:hypothetical protein VV02_01970 [Luteipulveratus mongoliensis]